jgi:hypothetical protein
MSHDEPPVARRERDDVPEGVDPLGVPAPAAARDTFILLLAVTAALLALIFTLAWVVYHHLVILQGLGG